MKRKDLVVGLDVAVKDGWGATSRAVLLELDTKWAFSLRAGYFKYSPSLASVESTIAVAILTSAGTWIPSVVKCRQILMSWSDYEAQQQRERDDRERKYKAEQAQREKYEKLRSRCAELLGCAVTSSRLGYAEVSLNDLYAIACKLQELSK